MTAAPLKIIDAHHHLWDLSVCHYPWLMEKGVKRFFGDPAPIQKNYFVEDFRADYGDLNIVKSVHIQVGTDEADAVKETEWLQSCVDAQGLPSAIVGFVDLAAENRDAALEAHLQYDAVRGVRQIVSRNAEEDARTGTCALLENLDFAAGLKRLADLNLSFDLQLTPPVLKQAAGLFCRHSDTKLALCHTASLQDFSEDGIVQWRSGLETLAAHENILCKISGFGMFDHQWNRETIRGYVLQAIDVFTPARVAFGSNFPVDKLYASYQEVMGAYLDITDSFSVSERQAMFHDNAENFYAI